MNLPTGYDIFGELFEHKLNFVDKSLFIKDLLDDSTTKISVITRPRRFGKTLNLTMLHYFFSLEYLLMGQFEKFAHDFRNLLEYTISYRDTADKDAKEKNPEAFYHGLMIGLTATLHYRKDYLIQSNRESGYGLKEIYDICSRVKLKKRKLILQI